MESRGKGVSKLLLAAGIVGLLAGVHAQDYAYADAPVSPYDEPYGDAYDLAYAPDDAVEGPEAAPPGEDAYGPSEEDVVQGPEEVAEGPAVGGDLTLDGFAAIPGSDYIPAFENAVPSENIGGQAVADQDECASICLADPACNAASFYLDPTPYGGNNCWTKTLSIPCELPSDASSDPNAVFLLQETECDPVSVPPFPAPEPEMVDEPMAISPLDMAPVDVPAGVAPRAFVFPGAPAPAAGDLASLMYFGYTGFDYVPQTAPPNLVSVENTLEPSSFVADITECAMTCDATAGCNAASFYADAAAFGGNNCWLKMIGDPCELPADAQADPGATLLMKQDICTVLGGIAPAVAPALAPIGLAPGPAAIIAVTPIAELPTALPPADGGIGLATSPTETIDGSTAGPVGADSASVAGEDAGSAYGIQTTIAAVAAIAAIAVFA